MKWSIGIDEAGYGPNLGPFVMSAVACRVEGPGPECLWERLAAALRRARPAPKKKGDTRIIADDSKLVHGSRGLPGLERGVLPLLPHTPPTLAALLADLVCPDDADELRAEPWFTGATALGQDAPREPLAEACAGNGVSGWVIASAVVCPARFNRVVERAGTKSAILADSFVRLLSSVLPRCPDADAEAFIDKQGGRNTYLMQMQQATGSLVRVIEEGEQASRYEAEQAGRRLAVSFLPRADGAHLCVALASMVSKYLRELFMAEFNGFWQTRVPGLAPTAGYPGDAPRYMEAIRPAAAELGLPHTAIWRTK